MRTTSLPRRSILCFLKVFSNFLVKSFSSKSVPAMCSRRSCSVLRSNIKVGINLESCSPTLLNISESSFHTLFTPGGTPAALGVVSGDTPGALGSVSGGTPGALGFSLAFGSLGVLDSGVLGVAKSVKCSL